MSDEPERVYLHKIIRSGRFAWLERENDDDIEYVRADLFEKLERKYERLIDVMAREVDQWREMK